MRINVIGTSGSGKTTFGRNLANILNIPFVEMDAIFWGPEWTFPDNDELFRRLAAALEAENWVLDGNYTRTLPVKWERVDTVIWLDFSFPRTLYQALVRAISRVFTGEELWPGTGNKESFGKLFSRESIVWWTIKTHRRNRKKNFDFIQSDEFSFIKFVRLRSPAEAEVLLQKISNHQEWILE